MQTASFQKKTKIMTKSVDCFFIQLVENPGTASLRTDSGHRDGPNNVPTRLQGTTEAYKGPQVGLVAAHPPASARDAGDGSPTTPGSGAPPGVGNIPAWEMPWTEEPGRLLSVASQRLGQD